MKYCCEKLESFMKDSTIIYLDSRYVGEDKEFRIVEEIRSCPDGDGITDTWVDEYKKIYYCPFCGKRISNDK